MKSCLFRLGLLLVLLMTLALAGVVYYAVCVERTAVELTHWQVESREWKGRPLRFVLLSDLHALPRDGDYIDRLVELTLAQEPDAVFLLGDYLTGGENNMSLEELAEHLKPLAKLRCYAVLGNHDYHYRQSDMMAMLRSFGAIFVEGRTVPLEVEGHQLDIGGLRSMFVHGNPGRVPRPEPGRPLLLLSHEPVALRHVHGGTAAVLAGHTHGGQVCLPGGRPLVRPDRYTPWNYMSGEVCERGIPMYVTRGVGTSTYALRLFCPPELTVVELVAAP